MTPPPADTAVPLQPGDRVTTEQVIQSMKLRWYGTVVSVTCRFDSVVPASASDFNCLAVVWDDALD